MECKDVRSQAVLRHFAFPRPVHCHTVPGHRRRTGSTRHARHLSRPCEAVVHIVSAGAAWRYDESEPSVEVGAGSGFIVDPEGIVVTNAHVVNGGNLFDVYLYGESEPRNAVLLGVSECDDLAVLDIRGSGFPYLLWQEAPLASSQVVYAAGYRSGEYTETSGRVQADARVATVTGLPSTRSCATQQSCTRATRAGPC